MRHALFTNPRRAKPFRRRLGLSSYGDPFSCYVRWTCHAPDGAVTAHSFEELCLAVSTLPTFLNFTDL